jgi:hypothetical protein
MEARRTLQTSIRNMLSTHLIALHRARTKYLTTPFAATCIALPNGIQECTSHIFSISLAHYVAINITFHLGRKTFIKNKNHSYDRCIPR